MKKILVVDDEVKIADVVCSYLEKSGYSVYEAYNASDALKLFQSLRPDLIILDLMLPDMPGEDFIRVIHRECRVPVIMLTAKIDEESILKGLRLGADDYVTKPFSPRQLIARVEAVLRRTADNENLSAGAFSFRQGDLVVDPVSYEVKKNNRLVNLTPNEFKILLTLIKYPKKAFTREELICLSFGQDFEGYDRIVDTHIKNLRQKIESDPRNPRYILTVHGIGYRFGSEKQ